MKKASYAALLGCVMLVLTIAATTTVNAAGMDSNIILVAIKNAVATLQNAITVAQNNILNAITNAQNNINAHTDSVVNEQNSIIINSTIDMPGLGEKDVEILPEVQGQTYSGHITLAVYGSAYIKVYVRAYVGGSISTIGIGDTTTDVNVGFACEKLVFHLVNTQSIDEPAVLRAVVQYVNCTNVSNPALT